jgi:hypothetical protein
VTAAAWLRAKDDGQWCLHLISPEAEKAGLIKANMTLLETVDALPPMPLYPGMPNARLEPADVRLLHPEEHLARRLRDVYDRYQPTADAFISGGRFDPYEYDSLLYVYALPTPAPVG